MACRVLRANYKRKQPKVPVWRSSLAIVLGVVAALLGGWLLQREGLGDQGGRLRFWEGAGDSVCLLLIPRNVSLQHGVESEYRGAVGGGLFWAWCACTGGTKGNTELR